MCYYTGPLAQADLKIKLKMNGKTRRKKNKSKTNENEAPEEYSKITLERTSLKEAKFSDFLFLELYYCSFLMITHSIVKRTEYWFARLLLTKVNNRKNKTKTQDNKGLRNKYNFFLDYPHPGTFQLKIVILKSRSSATRP